MTRKTSTDTQVPAVTAEWTAADMPGQYQALMALLFGGTDTTTQDEQLRHLESRCDAVDARLAHLENDAQDVAA